MNSVLNNLQRFESKIGTVGFSWFLNVVLAILIFFTAELGHLLGFQGVPYAISLVYPAAGFSLAALILFGFKVWPSIVVGNLCYNFLQLYNVEFAFTLPLLASGVIAIGTLLEALTATFVLTRWATPFYFSTVKDVFIFLIPAAGLGSIVAATINTVVFAYYADMPWSSINELWITLWTSSLLGLYIFTPLLVVWLTTKPMVKIRQYRKEAFFMLATFVLLGYLSFAINSLLILSLIPLNIWITYRFRMHGATLAILFMFLLTLVPTFFGMRLFITDLPFYVAFLEVTVITSLIFAALANEREAIEHLIESQHVDLKKIELYMRGNAEKTTSSSPKQATAISLNELLNTCLIQTIDEETQNHPEFTLTLTKKLDASIKKTIASPEDLALIFLHFFSNALHSMRQKKDLRGTMYVPELGILTKNYKKYIEIIIRDNGLGIDDERAKNLFQPFTMLKGQSEKITNTRLSLAHDIIVSTYHGSIRVEALEGEYFQLILNFPNT